jgi:hypothetical protein
VSVFLPCPTLVFPATHNNYRHMVLPCCRFLAPGSGTFFSDGTTIFYAPLDSEAIGTGAAIDAAGVVAARPGLTELLTVGAECYCSWGSNCTLADLGKCGLPSHKRTHDVHLENLYFRHTDTERYGQQYSALGIPFDFGQMSPSAFDHNQAASNLETAALHFEFVSGVTLRNVTVEHTGGLGIWLGAGVKDALFSRGRVEDTGAGAMRLGEAGHGTCDNGNKEAPGRGAYWCNATRTARNITVADSVLHDGGHIMKEGGGILLQVAANCTITHSSISAFRYTGITVGWSWNYGPTATGNNTISYNNISTIGMGELGDLGCVYHLGQDNGTRIMHNVCSNVSSFSYGGNAFYTDQGSQGVTISHNVAHDIKCAGFLQNFGLDVLVQNNVFAFTSQNEFTPGAPLAGMSCNEGLDERTSRDRSGAIAGGGALSGPTHGRFTFQRNIVYCSWYDGGPLLIGQGGLLASAFQDNLYWNEQPSAQEMTQRGFPCNSSVPKPGPWWGCSFEHWRSLDGAHDQGSRIVDPLFVDPAAGDFRLQSESPARPLGIDSLDTSTVGPRPRTP